MPAGGSHVELRIHDLTGMLVQMLIDGFEPWGSRTVRWSGKDDQGRSVASDRGQRTDDREAPVTQESRCRSGSRAAKDDVLIRGVLPLYLKG
ncbi:hypothetical protein KJ682_08495 [bacterium]|nr:hypothetical protein [bacterium]